MPPPGRGRGRGRGHPGPHRPHRPHPHPVPHRPHPHPHPHPKPVVAVPKPAAKQFERFYHWGNGVTVVITHSLGKNIRVKPGDHSKLDFEGGTGELARWKVHIHEGGSVIQLQSVKTGKFLRMQPNGNDFDVNGIAKGPNTYFTVERKSTGVAFLKTKKAYHNNQHAYLAVMHGHLAQKRLAFFREGAPQAWEKAYKFGHKRVVVLQHPGFKNLRVHDGKLEGNGATGKFGMFVLFCFLFYRVLSVAFFVLANTFSNFFFFF